MSTDIDFSNRDEVRRWLSNKPRGVVIVFAARAALRVAPLLGRALGWRAGGAAKIGREIVLPAFRAMAAPWVAGQYLTHGAVASAYAAYAEPADTADAARAAATRAAAYAAAAADTVDAAAAARAAADAADAAAYAAYAAAYAAAFAAAFADANVYADLAAEAADLAAEAAARAAAIARVAAAADARNIDEGASASALATRPLWLAEVPSWAFNAWQQLEAALLKENQDWRVWTDWYRARLEGRHANEALEVARVLIAEEIWSQGPRAVNAEIARLINQQAYRHRSEGLDDDLINPPVADAKRHDDRVGDALTEFSGEKTPLDIDGLVESMATPESGTLWVFFSYATLSTEEQRIQDEFYERLKEKLSYPPAEFSGLPKIDVWRGIQGAKGGQPLMDAACERAFLGLLMVSDKYPHSKYCKREAGFFLAPSGRNRKGKACLVVSVNIEPGQMPRRFTSGIRIVHFGAAGGHLVKVSSEGNAAARLDYVNKVAAEIFKAAKAFHEAKAIDDQDADTAPARGPGAQSQDWDFFLSFSREDEPFARWMEKLLRSAGFSVFAEFTEIPVGSNFVHEMQRGLARSARFVALLSPAYVKSEHCQAEWSAAFNADPGGVARKLVPFLVRPAELPPLARQIVYKHLIGLSSSSAATSILQAVGYKGTVRKIPAGWPGIVAVEQMQAATGSVYEVAPSDELLLERQPPKINEAAKVGFTPEQLFADFAREVQELAEHVSKGTGNARCSERLKDCVASLRQSTAEKFTRCDVLAVNKRLVWVLRTLANDRADGLIPRNDPLEHYASDLYGYYGRLEIIFPKLKPFREMDARHRFTLPSEEEERAIREVYRIFGDPDFAKSALSRSLSEEMRQVGESIEEAKENAARREPIRSSDVTIESHADAATRSLAVWNWLSNAREKFAKSGRSVEEFEEAIKGYEQLYDRMSPEMIKYIEYLLKWFF